MGDCVFPFNRCLLVSASSSSCKASSCHFSKHSHLVACWILNLACSGRFQKLSFQLKFYLLSLLKWTPLAFLPVVPAFATCILPHGFGTPSPLSCRFEQSRNLSPDPLTTEGILALLFTDLGLNFAALSLWCMSFKNGQRFEPIDRPERQIHSEPNRPNILNPLEPFVSQVLNPHLGFSQIFSASSSK